MAEDAVSYKLFSKNREIYRETSLDSRGCSAFRQLLPRCDEGPSAWAAIETGKNRELSRNFRPAGISPNEVSEAAEFWTRLKGASIVFSIGCAAWRIRTELNIESEKSQQSGSKGGEYGSLPRGLSGKALSKSEDPNCSGCIKGGSPRGSVLHGDPPRQNASISGP